MKRGGWPRESARHSLASRGVKSKRKSEVNKPRVPVGKGCKSAERPKNEEAERDALELACARIEELAAAQAGSEETEADLLADEAWIREHVDEVVASFELDDGIKSSLVAKIRKRFQADGE